MAQPVEGPRKREAQFLWTEFSGRSITPAPSIMPERIRTTCLLGSVARHVCLWSVAFIKAAQGWDFMSPLILIHLLIASTYTRFFYSPWSSLVMADIHSFETLQFCISAAPMKSSVNRSLTLEVDENALLKFVLTITSSWLLWPLRCREREKQYYFSFVISDGTDTTNEATLDWLGANLKNCSIQIVSLFHQHVFPTLESLLQQKDDDEQALGSSSLN